MKNGVRGYVNIQAFMVNDLHLSGNELVIYAVIFGFSQDGKSWFTGSRSYLAQWCQASEKSVTYNLKKLIDKNLIEKRQRSEGGRIFNDYRTLVDFGGGKKVPLTGEESSPDEGRNFPRPGEETSLGTGEETSHHTIEIDNTSREARIPYVEIVAYLNERTGRNFNAQAKATRKLIADRWHEGGRTIDDFKRVIDNKASQWLGNSKMEEYLRPSTLFAPTHFDEYLNERPPKPKADYSDVMSGWTVEHWGDGDGS